MDGVALLLEWLPRLAMLCDPFDQLVIEIILNFVVWL